MFVDGKVFIITISTINMFKSKNIKLMYWIQVIGGLMFFLPIIALYLEQGLFTITNVAIVFAVEAIAMALFEVPTGAIADLFGRKRTITLASVFVLGGLVFLYIGGSMFFFILFALFNAFGRSLSSGTENALIYDTLKDENKENQYKKIIGTYSALWPLGAVVGSLVGGYLATFSLSLPVLYTFIPISIVLILTFFLEEPKYEKEDHKNIIKHMFESSKVIIKNNQLIILFAAGFILWGFGESMHRLNSLFFEFKNIPILYFGVISAFLFGFSSIGHYFSHDVSKKIGDKKTLIFCTTGTALFILIATLTDHYVSIIFWAVPSVFFGLRNPIIDHLINIDTESRKRATVMSSYSFITRIGMAVVIPFIGYFAELYTINAAFRISALLVFIVPVLYLGIKEK